MALNFPASPTNGQTYTLNGITYTYSTTFNAWKETSVINVQGDIYGAANQVFAIANAALQNTSVTLQGTLTVTGGVLALGGISSQGTSASFNIYDRNLNGTYGSFYRSNNLTYFADSSYGNVIQYSNTGNVTILANTYLTPASKFTLDVNGTANTATKFYARQTQANFYNLKDFRFISASSYNALFLIIGNALYTCHGQQGNSELACARNETNYQTGYGLQEFRRVPFPAESASSTLLQADSYGQTSGYALFSSGNLYTWGNNNYGQLGVGDTNNRLLPTLSATGVTAVYGNAGPTGGAGQAAKLLIQKSDGFIYSCGYNGYGQLGLGNTTNYSSFQKITTFSSGQVANVYNLGADSGMTLFVLTDNSIYMCGYNGYGQFGNGNTSNLSTPTNMTTYWNASKLSISKISWEQNSVLYILLSNGNLYASGYNGNGQIGNGTTTNVSSPYNALTGVTGVWVIPGIGNTTVFAAKGTNLYSWGYNGYGQTSVQNAGNVVVSPTLVNAAFSQFMNENTCDPANMNYQQSIIKCTDNRLYGCGYNGHCELGIGYAQDYNDGWTQILLPSDFNPVVVGSVCSTGTTRVYMAIGSDNRAYGWGYNGQYGVIQNFIANNIDVPFQINLPFAG